MTISWFVIKKPALIYIVALLGPLEYFVLKTPIFTFKTIRIYLINPLLKILGLYMMFKPRYRITFFYINHRRTEVVFEDLPEYSRLFIEFANGRIQSELSEATTDMTVLEEHNRLRKIHAILGVDATLQMFLGEFDELKKTIQVDKLD
jgi:hypothetical protein